MPSVTTLGLGKTMEKKLHAVGIHSAEELTEMGSKQAVFRLKEQYPGTCVVILYHLEAAIRGCEIKQLEDKDEGGFAVSYPEFPGCITCGETIQSAVENDLDAKRAWIEAAIEEGIEIHEPDNLDDYSGQFKLRIPRSLHRLLAERSKREGISMNQYCVCLLSRNDAVYSK